MTQSRNSTAKHYQQLTPEERGAIEAYLNAGKSKAEISRLLHRNCSTISREIKRGRVQQRNHDYLFVYRYYADTCLESLQNVVDKQPECFKTITFDNGSEFKLLDQVNGPQIYFAHPYSPWE